jgi:PAS domain S-box-containing protein
VTNDSPASRFAWIPIPVLLLAMVAVRVVDFQATYDPTALPFSLHLLFMLCTSLWVVHLAARSFLASGAPGFLLLVCGAATLGLAGPVAFAVAPKNSNITITIHNTLMWSAATFHLLGVVLTFKRSGGFKRSEWWLLGGLSLSGAIVAFVSFVAAHGWLPDFFVQGQGGTHVRYIVLGAAIGMFGVSGATLLLSDRFTPKSFSRWYGFGLLLLATGIVGIMLQTKLGDAMCWAGRTAQWSGGVYLLFATIAAARQTGGRQISLAAGPSDPRLGYALAVAFVAAAIVGRMLFMHAMGSHGVTATFYPAVILAALLGGTGPGIVATILSTLAMDYFWYEPINAVGIAKPEDLVTTFLFLGSSAMVVFVTGAVQRERARAEAAEKIRASEERLTLAMKAGRMGAYDLDIINDVVWWSSEVYSIFGVSPDSFTPSRETFISLVHPEDREVLWKRLSANLNQRETFIHEFRIIRPDGSLRWIANRAQTEFRDDKPVRHFGMAVDITDRKVAEQELRKSQTLLSAVMSQLPVALGVSDVTGKWIVSNALMDRYAPKGMPSVHPERLSRWRFSDGTPLVSPPVNSPGQRALRGESVSTELRYVEDDGRQRWLRVSAAPLRADNGQLIGATAIIQDIDDIKQSEEQLRNAHAQLADRAVHLETLVRERTAKLQEMVNELEQVSYAITHDLRAPLRAMSAFANILIEESGTGEVDVVEYSQRILTASTRLDKLILDSLHYTKTVLREMQMQPVDISKLIRDLLATYPNLHPDNADICIVEPLPSVMGNEALLTQCFSNLLGNAVKFVAPGAHPQVRVRSESQGASVKIWVEDNGIGFPPEAHDRLFKMFERLTANYEGSGVGLAIVRKVVERMGGKVGALSEPGKGSRFWIELIAAPSTTKRS